MHCMNNAPYFLALNHIDFVGPRTVHKLLSQWPNLSDLFALSYRQKIDAGLSARLATAISCCDWKLVDEDLNWAQQDQSHHIITWDHADYPLLLREIHAQPYVLYAKGSLDCLKSRAIA